MTFSLVGRCADTGMLGMAITSSSPAVAARCAHARANVGAVATQNVTDPRLATQALDLLAEGENPRAVLRILHHRNEHMDYRQLLVVDNEGQTAIHSGSKALGTWAEARTEQVASGGNLLASEAIPDAMVSHFTSSSGHLANRLLGALRAGLDAGGEAGQVHSAGLLVVDSVSWPIVDLRCDWTLNCPIDTLEQIWLEYESQVQDYVDRALNPAVAPSYGVPGDL